MYFLCWWRIPVPKNYYYLLYWQIPAHWTPQKPQTSCSQTRRYCGLSLGGLQIPAAQMDDVHTVASLVVMMESLVVTMFTVVVSWTIWWAEHDKGCLQYDGCLWYGIFHLLAVLQTLAVTFHHCLQLSQQNLTTIAVMIALTMTMTMTVTVTVTKNW